MCIFIVFAVIVGIVYALFIYKPPPPTMKPPSTKDTFDGYTQISGKDPAPGINLASINEISNVNADNLDVCADACDDDDKCGGFVYYHDGNYNKDCYFRGTGTQQKDYKSIEGGDFYMKKK
jgi:hypothetical protein